MQEEGCTWKGYRKMGIGRGVQVARGQEEDARGGVQAEGGDEKSAGVGVQGGRSQPGVHRVCVGSFEGKEGL